MELAPHCPLRRGHQPAAALGGTVLCAVSFSPPPAQTLCSRSTCHSEPPHTSLARAQVENCQVFLGRVRPEESLASSVGYVQFWFSQDGNTLADDIGPNSGMLVSITMDSRVGGSIQRVAPNNYRIINGRSAVSASQACANDEYSCRPCRVMVLATRDVPWPALTTITSNWTDHVVEVNNHPFLDPIDNGNSTLVLRGGFMRVLLDGAKLGAIDADILSGSLVLQHLTLAASSPQHATGGSSTYSAADWPAPPWSLRTTGGGGATAATVAAGATAAPHDGASRLITANGDIHVSLQHSANVTYAQQQDASCLTAARVERASKQCVAWNTTRTVHVAGLNVTSLAVSSFQACTGSAFLCVLPDGGCGYGSQAASTQALHAAAAHGGVYITALRDLSHADAHHIVGRVFDDPPAAIECAAAQDNVLPPNTMTEAGAWMVTPLSPPLNVTLLAQLQGLSEDVVAERSHGVTVAIEPTSVSRLHAARRWIDSAPGWNFAVRCSCCGWTRLTPVLTHPFLRLLCRFTFILLASLGGKCGSTPASVPLCK